MASKSTIPGGRAFRIEAKVVWDAEIWLKRQSTPAGLQRWHGCKGMQSNWRSAPHPGAKPPEEVFPITDDTGKWEDGVRVADGSVVAKKRGNSRGAKGPCCRQFLAKTVRQGRT